MSLKTVYRVENQKTGLGPYIDSHDITFWLSSSHKGPKYPFVNYDDVEKLESNGEVYFGFDSFEDLFNWFTQAEIADLYNAGFAICVYRVCDMYVIKSEKQVIFNKDLADKIEVIDFDRIPQLI